MAIMLVINGVIKAVAWAWDEFNTTVAETKSDLDETQSTISSLKTQIEELEKIDANALTQGQKDKLENLKEQLKVQEQLEEIEKRRLARETIGNGNFTDYFDKDSYKNAHVGIMKDLTKYQGDIDGLAPLYEKRSESVKRKSILVNEGLETSTDVSGLQESLRRAEEKQDKTRQEILLLQEGLISNKADIQNWINTIEGYISDGSLVGEDLTQANEDLKELYGNLEYVNGQLTYTNNLLYGGDDSWENVLAEKTQYSLKNLKDYGFTDGELEILSTLTFDHDSTLTELRTILNESQKVVDENPVTPKVEFSKTQMIDTINSMADGFDVLDDIYADVLDGGTFDFTKLDTSKFSEAFSEITPEYEKFIETVSASPTDIDACQGAFNDLVSAFIDSKGILSGLTEENKDLTISMLQNMGVANAEEIVNYALAQSEAEVAAQKILNTNASFDLANATVVEIQELLNEAGQSEETKQKLASLLLQKQLCNQTTIMTDGDIQNLEALAEQAGATASAIATAKQMASDMQTAGAGRLYSNNPEKAKAKYQQIYASLANDISKQAKLKYTQATNGSLTPKYTGANATADAIEKANKSASDSAKDATEEAKKAYSDWFDFMERRVEVLDDAFANLEKGMENVVGAFAKNSLVDAQLGIVDEEINNYTDALAMYKQQAQNVLSTIEDADLRDKIVNGAVELSQIQGENADVVKSAMEAYQNWSGKIAECNQKLEELRTQIRQLELAKFENIIEDYTNQFDLYGDSIDLIKGQIGLLEEAGQLVGKNYYTTHIAQSEKQLATLEKQKADMIKQMTDAIDSRRIQRGTDEWLEMQQSLTEVDSEIIDVKTNIEELNNDLQELNWSIFERVHTEFENLNSELENLAGLFDDFNDIKVSDGKGNWTDEAISTLGLYMQQYELARYRANSYSEAIDKLNENFQNGDYSATEYMDKLAELKENMWQSVNSAESLEDAIVDLNQIRIDEEIETIEDEIDAYEKLIDTQLELIDETEELRKKREDLAEKSKSVTDIERQLASMQNDDSQATIAKRKLLEAELAEAKNDLENAEHEYSVESQRSALEQQLEDYQNARNAEIEALRLSLENRELLISQSFENVKANSSIVGEQIALIAQQHGITVSDALITSWANGETAIASYGETLSAQSSAFIGNIMSVEAQVYNLQTQADNSSIALANMFATRADNLVGQLQTSYMAEGNLNYATGVLQNSLINTLERGYNISGTMSAMSSIASGMSNVENSARRAAQAIQEALGAQSASKEYYHMGASIGKNGETTYYIQELYSGQKVKESGSYSEISSALDEYKKNNYNFKAYAKGGIVSKEDKGVFDPFAKALGEDTMVAVKYGEGILTQKQTSMLQNFANILPDINQLWNVPDYAVQTPVMQRNDRPNVTINYDKMYEINGDIYDAYQFENKVAKISKNQTTKILNDINRDFRIHSR